MDCGPLFCRTRRADRVKCLYFSKALFEGLMFGGAYICWEICVKKSIRLVCTWKANEKIMLPYIFRFVVVVFVFV